jgi:hypothetical protein
MGYLKALLQLLTSDRGNEVGRCEILQATRLFQHLLGGTEENYEKSSA